MMGKARGNHRESHKPRFFHLYINRKGEYLGRKEISEKQFDRAMYQPDQHLLIEYVEKEKGKGKED